MPPLSVIIPSKNVSNLSVCLGAVAKHEPDLRIIVVDDGLKGRPEGPVYIQGIKPFIFSRNINLGIEAAGRDDVILLNDDAILETRGGFREMRQQWKANQQYGIIGSSIDYCGTPDQHRHRGRGLRELPWMVVFACVFIPRRTIDVVGLLDECFGVNAGGPGVRGYGCDDDDYSWRVRKAGLKLGVSDSCFVNHTSLPSTFRGDREHPASPRLHEKLFQRKWGQHPHAWCK